MGEEETSDTTGRQTEVSGDKINDRGTYGAAIEVPERVLVDVLESIPAETTSTPRNQTGKISGMAAGWCGERRLTIEHPTEIGEVSLGLVNVKRSWGIYISIVKGRKIMEILRTDGDRSSNASRGFGRSVYVIITGS